MRDDELEILNQAVKIIQRQRRKTRKNPLDPFILLERLIHKLLDKAELLAKRGWRRIVKNGAGS